VTTQTTSSSDEVEALPKFLRLSCLLRYQTIATFRSSTIPQMVVNYSSEQQPLDNERENHTKGAVKEEQTIKTTRIPLLSSSTRRIAHTPNNAQHSLPQQHTVPKKLTRRRS